jgi:hypothetical protein
MEEEQSSSRIEGAIERLNQDPYLMSVITAVPVVGGSITQVLTGIGQQIVQERNAKMFEQLKEHLATVQEQSIRSDYFETPEGFDLLIKALDESRRTRSDDKRDLIARILSGAASADAERGEYSPEEYLNIVADLTVKELEIARIIYQVQQEDTASELEKEPEVWFRQRNKIIAEHELEEDEFSLLLNRVASTGLLSVANANYPGYTVPTYWVSPTFYKLMKFLRLEP